MKHVIGQSIFQLIVLIVLIFWGEKFIPDNVDTYDNTIFVANPEWKWNHGLVGTTVCSGRMITISG